MSLSPAQLAQRRGGASASDIAPIVGLDPYRSPVDVWLDKTGRAAPFAGNSRTHWGNVLEGPIRADYAERRGLRVEVPGTLDHPTIPWAKATPDGICYVMGNAVPVRGLEIKTHSFRTAHWYGEPGTDQVPAHELIQCMWNMFVTGLEVWDLVAFIDGQPADYLVRRDDDLIGTLRERVERFLVDNVKADKPPEPDGSESYDRYLSTRFSHRNDTFVNIDTRPEVLVDVQRLREVRAELDELEAEESTIEQRLKLVIGDDSGLEWTDFGTKKKANIYYRLASDGSKTDFAAAYAELATRLQLLFGKRTVKKINAEMLEARDAHTKITPGSRRFIVPRSWSKKNNKEK
jgi:putative phage-type endonuclease